MATASAAANKVKQFNFTWEGKDKSGKVVKGEMRAEGQAIVSATLRRQGILVGKVKKRGSRTGGSVGVHNGQSCVVTQQRDVRCAVDAAGLDPAGVRG